MTSPYLSIRDTDNELRLRFTNNGGDTGINAYPVGQILSALQDIFNRVARSRSELLGELRDLPQDERLRLLTLEIVDARMGSLELLMGPNRHYARTYQLQHSEQLNVAFKAISSLLITSIDQAVEGVEGREIPGPFRTGLHKLAAALIPDKLSLKVSLGVISAQADYNLAERLSARETARKQESQQYQAIEDGFTTKDRIPSIPRLEGPQRSFGDSVSGVSGPYNGMVLSIDPSNRSLSLRCDDYTVPIDCRYDSDMTMIVSTLAEGQRIAIWGYPMRVPTPSTRSDKPPSQLTHIDISLHPDM